MRTLSSTISNEELLELYGYEPYAVMSVRYRWNELTNPWYPENAEELGSLRQVMLQIHLDLCPNDERWR